MEKKRRHDWYIAFIYWGMGGFLVPVVVMLVPFIVSLFIVKFDANGNFVDPMIGHIFSIVFAFMNLVATWFGAYIAAGFVKRRYEIPDPRKILNIALSIFIILGVAFAIEDVLTIISVLDTSVNIVALIAEAATFYFASKKYLLP